MVVLLVLLTFIESKVVPRIGKFNSRIECPQSNTASAFVRAVNIEVYSADSTLTVYNQFILRWNN